jgi:nucleoside phosphorylase
VHDAADRARLREASGADAVDMESGVLARSGRLAGVVRAISDDAASAVDGVDRTVHADGRTNVAGLLRWVATRRGDAVRSMRDALRALHALEEAVAT